MSQAINTLTQPIKTGYNWVAEKTSPVTSTVKSVAISAFEKLGRAYEYLASTRLSTGVSSFVKTVWANKTPLALLAIAAALVSGGIMHLLSTKNDSASTPGAPGASDAPGAPATPKAADTPAIDDVDGAESADEAEGASPATDVDVVETPTA
ncbi:MAG: hypothetical protein PVI40_02985 [Chlamydiota bacterium]|jgi:hypothetical protein